MSDRFCDEIREWKMKPPSIDNHISITMCPEDCAAVRLARESETFESAWRGPLTSDMMCQHGNDKMLCPFDSGNFGILCQHDRLIKSCRQCRSLILYRNPGWRMIETPDGLCQHGRRIDLCSECRVAPFCQHGRSIDLCSECRVAPFQTHKVYLRSGKNMFSTSSS